MYNDRNYFRLTGMWKSSCLGAAMTNAAFVQRYSIPILGKLIISIGLAFFAFTILGWNYYGEKMYWIFIWNKGIKPYRYAFIAMKVAIGRIIHT